MPVSRPLRARLRVALLAFLIALAGAAQAAWADFIGHGGMVRAVDITADGRTVITASFDFSARLWDFGSQAQIAVLDAHQGPVTGARFFPDGKRAVTTSDDGLAIIWSVPDGKEVRRLQGHRHKVMAVDVSADGRRVATGGWDKTVRIWDAASGKELQVIEQPAPVNDVAFTDGGKAVAVGDHDGKIGLWRVADGQALGVLDGHRRGITRIDASRDGRLLLSASIDRTVRLWDLAAQKELKVLTHSEERDGQVYAVAFSPDENQALSAGRDGRLVLWSLEAGSAVKAIPTDTKIIWAVGFSPDGRFALTASSAEVAAVWHLDTGDRIGLRASDKDAPKPWLSSNHPGARLFSSCANCHALDAKSASRSGPHFEGLWGRRVGAVEGYNYSNALMGKSFTWNEKTLFDLFAKGPDKFLPGTKMPVQRVPDKDQLSQLVDYLRVLTTSPPPGAK